MHELAEAITDRKGLAWIAATAFFYVLVLVLFNQYQLEIIGIVLRPAAVVPVVAGPAAFTISSSPDRARA